VVADWIAAIGTAAATLIAAGALAAQQRDRRREIVRAVNGWATIDNGTVSHIVLSNMSPLPIYDVIARLIFRRETIAVVSPDCVPPGTHEYAVQAAEIWACVADLNTTEQGPKVALVFREPSGRVWRKSSRGRIRRYRRKYVWASEYQGALAELPPSLDVDGNLIDTGVPRRSPRD
jgi:hypothetical protein